MAGAYLSLFNPDEGVQLVWHEHLEKYDCKNVKAGIKQWINSGNKFPPNLAEVLSLAKMEKRREELGRDKLPPPEPDHKKVAEQVHAARKQHPELFGTDGPDPDDGSLHVRSDARPRRDWDDGSGF